MVSGKKTSPQKRTKNGDANRNGKGQFVKGNNANPGGRPAAHRDFVERCRAFMEAKGWPNLESMASDPSSPHYLRANELIAAYAYGKPPQEMKHEGGDRPIILKVEYANGHAR